MKIGLKYYHASIFHNIHGLNGIYTQEFQMRIPREEVSIIESLIKANAKRIDKNIKCLACGSYRRGKKDCGDIDILITHKKGYPGRNGGFNKILKYFCVIKSG
jgi:DNA polymerase/3'-5' exonuclease PolX